ncbi:MAG: tetratricopeptide repeat protein [Oscillospiraceae bacterium]|nr:tetratricopeptide repeat protein [Oscillospiraceae bacterium]
MASCKKCEKTASHKKRNIIIIAAVVLVVCATAVFVLYNWKNNPSVIRARAERHSVGQNYEQAIADFQRLIEISPDDSEAYINLADVYIGSEQPDKALETLNDGFSATYDEGILTKLVGLLSENANKYLNEKDYEQAISEFERVIELDSGNAYAYMGLASSYIALNDTDNAVEILKKAAENTDDNNVTAKLSETFSTSAEKNLSEKNFEDAVSDYKQIISLDNKNVEAYVGLANSYKGLANTEKAIETLKAGFETTGDDGIKVEYINALSESAKDNFKKKNYEKANKQYSRLIELDDKNADTYIALADSYKAAKNNDKAIETLEKGLEKTNAEEIKTKLINLLTQKANSDLSAKKFDAAITSFKKLVNLNAKNDNAYIGLANSYIGLGKNDDAVKALQEGYDKTSNSDIKEMLMERLLISASALSAEDSVVEYQKILTLDDAQKDAYTGLANAYIELGQKDKAVEILQTGVEKTGDAEIKRMLGELTYDIEKLDAVMYTTTDIGVWTETNVSSEKVGSLGTGDKVTVTGKANNGWYRISYNGEEYFVNGAYLSTSKPVEPVYEPTPAPTNSAEALLNSVTLNPQKTGNELLDSLVESILSKITNDNMSTYEKVKACYDYAINNFSYGQTGENLGWGIKGWAYEVLVNNSGVCNNYSSAFAVMTRAIGLETYLQNGQTSSSRGGYTGHTWCTMMINGIPYLFDPQVEDNIAKGGPIYYYKFCKTYDDSNAKGYYIPSGNKYYLENEREENGDLLIEPGMSNSGWWFLF